MTIRFITGVEHILFLNACALVSSFRVHEPEARIEVCDFGLTPQQAAFLDKLGLRIPAPKHLLQYEHPYFRKGAIVDFLEGQPFDALVWLDADMILSTPIKSEIENLRRKMSREGKSAAACLDVNGMTLGEFVKHWRNQRNDIGLFARRLDENPALASAPYINSATVILGSEEIGQAWRDETLLCPIDRIEFLFEQNAFNRIVWSNGPPLILDTQEWNVNAEMAGDQRSPKPTNRARVLHASGTPETMRVHTITVNTKQGRFSAPLKTFARPDLMSLHIEYIRLFLTANEDALAASGLLKQ